MNIPMNVEVYCTDGLFGCSSRVVLNPKNKKVTHLVVKEANKTKIERLIPIRFVAEATLEEIRLSCTMKEASKMNSFFSIEYIKPGKPQSFQGTEYMPWPDVQSRGYSTYDQQLIKVQYERIPPGELAIKLGAKVRAMDGAVGHLREFLVNPKTGNITHLVLREGHLWGKKDVTIDMSYIERIEEKCIYLMLNSVDIGRLPAVPVRQRKKEVKEKQH